MCLEISVCPRISTEAKNKSNSAKVIKLSRQKYQEVIVSLRSDNSRTHQPPVHQLSQLEKYSHI